MKILRVDPDQAYHVLLYQLTANEPTMAEVASLDVWAYHVPIASLSDARRLGSSPVVMRELVGFHEFLKQTDFKRYATETGQSTDALIAQANSAMDEGNRLKHAGNALAVIEKYTEAVDCFPLYFEAIDNRAFARMDLGDWDGAIADFKESERENEPTIVTIFSIGECHLKAGRFDEARVQFTRCVERDPQNPDFGRFLQMAIDRKQPE